MSHESEEPPVGAVLTASGAGRKEELRVAEESVPPIGEGEFLVRNLWLSCDPAQRAWMEHDTYIPCFRWIR
jgi:NADPH-dependent curcumin reductase CurA